METLELRKTMKDYVEEADERLLSVLKAVVESYKENDTIAYSINSNPVTRKKYCQGLSDAEAEVARGEFTTQVDIEMESEKW